MIAPITRPRAMSGNDISEVIPILRSASQQLLVASARLPEVLVGDLADQLRTRPSRIDAARAVR